MPIVITSLPIKVKAPNIVANQVDFKEKIISILCIVWLSHATLETILLNGAISTVRGMRLRNSNYNNYFCFYFLICGLHSERMIKCYFWLIVRRFVSPKYILFFKVSFAIWMYKWLIAKYKLALFGKNEINQRLK